MHPKLQYSDSAQRDAKSADGSTPFEAMQLTVYKRSVSLRAVL